MANSPEFAAVKLSTDMLEAARRQADTDDRTPSAYPRRILAAALQRKAPAAAVERSFVAYQVARQLNASVRTVRWWTKTGRMPARRDGLRIWKFLERDVESRRTVRARRGGTDGL